MEKGLDYIFNERTKMIILGTFPSIQSRDICYYNNPMFFKMMRLLLEIKTGAMPVCLVTALVFGMLYRPVNLSKSPVWTAR